MEADRLNKLFAALFTDHEGERLAAASALVAHCERAGLHPADLLVVAGPPPSPQSAGVNMAGAAPRRATCLHFPQRSRSWMEAGGRRNIPVAARRMMAHSARPWHADGVIGG